MKSQFENYLDNGSSELLNRLSSNTIDIDEKEALIHAFSRLLDEYVNGTDRFVDLGYFFESESIKHMDLKIYEAVSQGTGDYNEAICLAERYLAALNLFGKNNWPLPSLKINDIEECLSLLKKRESERSLIGTIEDIDIKLSELLANLRKKPTLKGCDQAKSLTEKLASEVQACTKSGLEVPHIQNHDTEAVIEEINAILSTIEKNANIKQRIVDIDVELLAIELSKKTVNKQWIQAVALCQEQQELFDDCKERGINIPKVKCSNLSKISSKYGLFIKLESIDKSIGEQSATIDSEEKMADFSVMCSEQAQNISLCRKNRWQLPNLKYSNPSKFCKKLEKKLGFTMFWKKVLHITLRVALVIISLIILGIIGYIIYCNSQAKMTINPGDLHDLSYDQLVEELKNSGFTNFIPNPDYSGWKEDGTVQDILVDGISLAEISKEYFDPQVPITILYTSDNRSEITDLLSGWQDQEYKSLYKTLESNGFDNIKEEEVITNDKTIDGLVAKLVINGEDYIEGKCFIPENAPLDIYYYKYKVSVGDSPSALIGGNYTDVLKHLKDRGFTNVTAKQYYDGWGVENKVVKITINGSEDFKYDDTYEPDAQITVLYNSIGRIGITNILSDWENEKYKPIIERLKKVGISEHRIKTQPIRTDTQKKNSLINRISIGGMDYSSGECFVPTDAEITIEYNYLYVTLDKDEETLIEQADDQYNRAVTSLELLGFNNIELRRTNDLSFFSWTDEGEIKSISIDGKHGFKKGDVFQYDAPIVIVVYTTEDGLPGITKTE